jgi:hypothetical protein
MKIWHLKSNLSGEFEDLQLVNFKKDNEHFDEFNKLDTLASTWSNVEVYTLTNGRKSDFPMFWGHGYPIPVLSEGALNVVQDFFKGTAEVLPLSHPDHMYYAVHVLNVINAVNYGNCVFEEVSPGRPVSIKRYSFLPDKVVNEHIFKVYLNDKVFFYVFVSDTFKERVTSSSLVGYHFVEVWDSEKEDSDQPFFPSGVV